VESASGLDVGQREAFERDGYLVIDPEIPPETLERVIADLDGQYRPARNLGPLNRFRRFPYQDWVRIQDAWRASKSVKAVARAPKVLALLRELYGREPLPFQTLNFRVGTQQKAHSDTLHFNSEPSGFMCGVWVALEDIDEDNGPLFYYRGSHKLVEVTMQDVGVSATRDEYPRYEEHLQRLIDEKELTPSYGLLRKGQALVWAANLMHGGAKQRDPDRTRLSQVTHYFFEGCRYYTPMLSTPEQRAWRHPKWIT
jgi:ectoine hydroxylase-related dioxygenase (phytanoyl-CoA dioxygenase family)